MALTNLVTRLHHAEPKMLVTMPDSRQINQALEQANEALSNHTNWLLGGRT